MDHSTIPICLSFDFSDLIIKCGSAEFPVHKVMIGNASDAIYRALTGPFTEAETGVYEITDSDEETVKRMIHFLYTYDYSVKEAKTDKNSLANYTAGREESATVDCDKRAADEAAIRHEIWFNELMAHARLNALARKYLFTCLVECTRENIETLLKRDHDFNAVRFCEFASYCLEHSGDKDLHELITVTGAKHHEKLAGLPELAELKLPQEFLADLLGRSLKVKADAAARTEAKLIEQMEDLRRQNAELVSERQEMRNKLQYNRCKRLQARDIVRAIKEGPSWDHTKCEACGKETRYIIQENDSLYYLGCRHCGESHHRKYDIDKDLPITHWR